MRLSAWGECRSSGSGHFQTQMLHVGMEVPVAQELPICGAILLRADRQWCHDEQPTKEIDPERAVDNHHACCCRASSMTMLVRMPSPIDKAATANVANVMRTLESTASISKPSAWSPRVAMGQR